jgi:two-component system LytT family response regulator
MVLRKEVSLQQEWNIISLYLELEYMRYSETFSYKLSTVDNAAYRLPSLIIYQHLEVIVYELIIAGLPKVHLEVASETNDKYLSVHIRYNLPDVSRIPSDLQTMKQHLQRRLNALQKKHSELSTTTDHTGVTIHIPLSIQDQIPNSSAMQKVVIIEDEKRSREFLKEILLEHCEGIEITGLGSNVAEGIDVINTTRPQIVFLDIELQTGTGFDVLEQVTYRDFAVIFTTAYDHYALKAIKFSAADYLLKPISVEELKAAVAKVSERRAHDLQQQTMSILMQNLKSLRSNTEPTITLSLAEGLEFVPIRDILRVEAGGSYTNFFLKEGRKILVSKNLKEYEQLLCDYDFMRVHNSHIINLSEVKKMLKTDGGYAVMSDGTQIIISPKKKDDFIKAMSQRHLQ